MTDSIDTGADEGTSTADILGAIEAARPALMYGRSVSKGYRGTQYNTATDTFTHTSAQGADTDGPPPASGNADMADTHDLGATFKQLVDSATALQVELDAHTFDETTGTKVPALTGETRRVKQVQYDQMMETANYQYHRYTAALEARQAQAANAQRHQEAAAIEQAWTGGDPRRAALLKDEMERAEARALAELSIRKRLGQI